LSDIRRRQEGGQEERVSRAVHLATGGRHDGTPTAALDGLRLKLAAAWRLGDVPAAILLRSLDWIS
jgi:hypothetical protein